jgi:hypothetical protein
MTTTPRAGGRVGRGAAVVAIVAAALTMASTASPWSRQASLEQRATTLTGLQTPIVCETALEHAQGVKAGGTAYYGFTLATSPRLVVLAPSVCRLLRTADRETPAFAFAVWVLAHELGHVVRDTNDETVAECYAMERWTQLAARLGLAAPTPDQVARVAAGHDALPARYRRACS